MQTVRTTKREVGGRVWGLCVGERNIHKIGIGDGKVIESYREENC